MSDIKRGVFKASDLVPDTGRHLEWKCSVCPAVLVLEDSDPRVGQRSAPKCEECGAWTVVYGPITRVVN